MYDQLDQLVKCFYVIIFKVYTNCVFASVWNDKLNNKRNFCKDFVSNFIKNTLRCIGQSIYIGMI